MTIGLRIARNHHGDPTSIADVPSGLACRCTCPHLDCGEALVAKKGAEKAHHFSHRPNSSCPTQTTSGTAKETELHFAAKHLVSTFKVLRVPPFRCSAHVVDAKGVLHKGYSRQLPPVAVTVRNAFVEQRQPREDVVPDVTIESEAGLLLVEIVVTNDVKAAKLEKLERLGMPVLAVRIGHLAQQDWTLASLEPALVKAVRNKGAWVYRPEQVHLRSEALKEAKRAADDAEAADDLMAFQQALAAESDAEDAFLAEQARAEEADRVATQRAVEAAEASRLREVRLAQERAAAQVRAEQFRLESLERERLAEIAAAAAEEQFLREEEERAAAEAVWRQAEEVRIKAARQTGLVSLVLARIGGRPICAAPGSSFASNEPSEEVHRLRSTFDPHDARWVELMEKLGVKPGTCPSYLDIPIDGESCFSVPRQAWQALVFERYVNSTPRPNLQATAVNTWVTQALRGITLQKPGRSGHAVAPGRVVTDYLERLSALGLFR